MLDPCGLAVGVSALGAALAKQLTDNQLELWAAIFNQLGETLATIAVQRQLCQDCACLPENENHEKGGCQG